MDCPCLTFYIQTKHYGHIGAAYFVIFGLHMSPQMIDMQTIAEMTHAPRPIKVQLVYVKKKENPFGGRLFTDVWILRVEL